MSVDRYNEVPASWSRVIQGEVDAGHRLEDLVFVEQSDGSLLPLGQPMPSLGCRPNHCVIVKSIGKRPDGESYANVIYAASFDGVLRTTEARKET